MPLPDFRSADVLVVGDLMLDRYWHGNTLRISPEAPVPVVHVKGNEARAGGAGNVALNIAALGARATVMGYCGRDEAGDTLIGLLKQAGIGCSVQRHEGLSTITKLRVVSRHQQLIRLDFEDSFRHVDPRTLLEDFERGLNHAGVVLLSDYGKGTLAPVQQLIERCQAAGKPVLVDPKGRDFDRYRRADLITPNLAEFEQVVGPCRNEAEIEKKGRALLESLELGALLITRGEHGMSLLRAGTPALHLPAKAREVYDVTGAGDTVIAVLAAALAAGHPLPESVALANIAAGIVVGKLGTASVGREEMDYAVHGQRAQRRGVIAMEGLLLAVQAARQQGERIVLTNGCFDILHPGHIHYLQQARELGDRLIVLVNSDDSVRRLKGQGRPINSLDSRMAMLAALECIDWVSPFEEDTPRGPICRILPDILVKGGDYADITAIAGHDCVMANGGEVKLLPFVEGFSTTGIIETIRNV
ncbi:MAG: bifunctional D-glycero-beta-D-manno-heptose-7-phosphate kinase/D-glycero-beta-D-manno-heptose 1-phosphate adenylyltransferase HldE [Methylococcaceae bacterium]|nr:bifunctional D-glycero-beta-D-manno-heptose-7-phosphate kinase/D-glycero-beta-D-manno-heptose 1-phosphate adenylyltransferase HldE [Methylococcaceae bacterium]